MLKQNTNHIMTKESKNERNKRHFHLQRRKHPAALIPLRMEYGAGGKKVNLNGL